MHNKIIEMAKAIKEMGKEMGLDSFYFNQVLGFSENEDNYEIFVGVEGRWLLEKYGKEVVVKETEFEGQYSCQYEKEGVTYYGCIWDCEYTAWKEKEHIA